MNNQDNCQNRHEAIAALVLGVLDTKNADELQKHIESCQDCRKLYQNMLDEEKDIRSTFNEITQKGEVIQSSLIDKLDNSESVSSHRPKTITINWGNPLIKFAAAILIISSLAANFVLSQKNVNLKDELELARQNIFPTPIDDSVTINFYLKEHQDTIARYASNDLSTSQLIQMQINQDEILYYELFGNQSEFLNPGIIVRGPSIQNEISMPESPTISNGHSMTISEAREVSDFDLISPSWLHPGYSLDQIRRIEDKDALHLLYTDGENTLSLFEQPLDGQQGLSPQDFREYAVFSKQGQPGRGTILAWRDEALSFVLIGNIEMSQLMNMAQSISAEK